MRHPAATRSPAGRARAIAHSRSAVVSARSLALSLACAAALAGCGVSARHPPAERGADIARTETNPLISSRPPNTVLVDGATLDVLTPVAVDPFQSASTGRVVFTATNSRQAFADLCDGKVDVIEPGRAITPAEAAACRRNHLELLGGLAVGWDAVVIAVKNEADIGGDCLTTQQARDIFRAGSPYSNWSQLGFYDVPLASTGSLSEPVPDELFARSVLAQPAPLTSAALRGDFIATPTTEATRAQIVGSERLTRAQAIARRKLAALRAQTAAQRKRLVNAAMARADEQVLRAIAATNARNRRLKIVVNTEQLDRHNAQIDTAAKRAAALRANAQFDAQLAERASKLAAPLLARAQTPGVVGFVRFTYYEQWEEQLRPFEIWAGGSSTNAAAAPQSPNCVFPSEQTISSGHYPFAFGLVLYTTRQALARGAVRDYLTYLFTNAQAFATNSGLVPVTDSQRNTDLTSIGAQPLVSTSTPTTSSQGASSAAPSAGGSPAPQTPAGTSAVPGVGASPTSTTQAPTP